MKIATFTHQGTTRIGLVIGQQIADVCTAVPDLPRELVALLTAGPAALERAAKAAPNAPMLALSQIKLEAPVLHPPEFLAIGLNYADHVAETGRDKPQFPIFFNKQSSCVNGPYDSIHMPRVSTALDYEGELGFVMGGAAGMYRASAHMR